MLYALGFPLGFALRWLDPPRAVGIVVVAPWAAAVLWCGAVWLVRAVDDGALRRALPEYGLAFLGLVAIASAFALITVLVLLAIGEEVTVTGASSGAAIGTLALVLAWPLARSIRQRRAVDNSG